jgi:hypothetical protein
MTAREVVVWEEAHSLVIELIFCSWRVEGGKKKDHYYFYLHHLELQMHGWSAGEE